MRVLRGRLKMAKKSPRIRLTHEECDVLYKIAVRSKMDSWFAIEGYEEEFDNGEIIIYDRVFDLENNRRVTLRYGVGMLDQGMTGFKDYDLKVKEINTYIGILDKLGIESTLKGLPDCSKYFAKSKKISR